MKLHFVDSMDEVLALALEAPLPGAIPVEAEGLTPTVAAGEVGNNLPAPQ